MMSPRCISKLKTVGKILKHPETMRYKLYILNANYSTSRSCFHRPSPSPQISRIFYDCGTYSLPYPISFKRQETSTTNQVSNTPEENMQCHCSATMNMYTIHPHHPEIPDGKSRYVIFMTFDGVWFSHHQKRLGQQGIHFVDQQDCHLQTEKLTKVTLGEGAS